MDRKTSPFETLTMLKVLLHQGNQGEAFTLYQKLCRRGMATELRQDPEVKRFLASSISKRHEIFNESANNDAFAHEQWMDLLEDWLEKLRPRKAHV